MSSDSAIRGPGAHAVWLDEIPGPLGYLPPARCEHCAAGVVIGKGLGHAEPPRGCVIVQACGRCGRLADEAQRGVLDYDQAAAQHLAALLGTAWGMCQPDDQAGDLGWTYDYWVRMPGRPAPWVNRWAIAEVTDLSQGIAVLPDGRLGVRYARRVGSPRDEMVREAWGTPVPAPPAQQYGHRCARWVRAQRCAELSDALAAAAPPRPEFEPY